MRGLLRFILDRLWVSLSVLLGVMQTVVVHWLYFLFAGAHGAVVVWLAVAVVLASLNVWLIPVIAELRGRGGGWRRVSGVYMGGAGATTLAGCVILGAWMVSVFAPDSGMGDDAVFARVSVTAVAGLVGMVVWGFSGGQSRIAVTRHRIIVPGLGPGVGALRLVQISDLHIGNGLEGARLADAVARVNALDPDVIVITGDLFDFDPIANEACASPLGDLSAPLGVYAVLGNHDYHAGFDRVARAMSAVAPGIKLLRDDFVRLATPEPCYLAGVDDPGCDWAARDIELPALETLAARLPDDGPALLLVHRPEVYPQADRLGFSLVLAGHTHGGQVALPGPGRHLNPARLISRFDRGIYRGERSTLYVNRGLGVAGPSFRLNCPREIAAIELVNEVVGK